MATAPTRLPAPTPVAVWALAAVALAAILAPIVALGARVPWAQLGTIAAAPDTRQMLRVTLTAALLATLCCLALGIPLALWMQRRRRAAALTRLLVLLPLALPPVVAGMALGALLGNRGLAAPLLEALNLQFAFAFPGVVAAHTFVALPFVVITLDAALRQLDAEVVDSAHGVGLTPAQTTRRIVLPAIAPAIASAAGLAFARSLGEFGTTLTFAGSMPGVTRTMPLGIYLAREIDQDTAYGLAAILVALAVAALAVAALPLLHRRAPAPRARVVGNVDATKLAELTRPTGHPAEVAIGAITFPAGDITALIGPNGAGKTTLAGRIAGRLAAADVRFAGRQLAGVPAHRRGVVLLTQDPGLPPTATAAQAVGMVAGNPRELLAAAGLDALADVPVPALSAGQAAQVALVRALAVRPRVLILDEPLAALDVHAAAQWRRVLAASAGERTTIWITHSYQDLALADHVAVMERGEVVALRPAAEELARPATAFSAALAGRNWVRGRVTADSALDTPLGTLRGTPGSDLAPGSEAAAVFSPADAHPAVPGPGTLTAAIAHVAPAPSGELAVTVGTESAHVTVLVPAGTPLGDTLTFRVAPERVALYPPANGGSTSTR